MVTRDKLVSLSLSRDGYEGNQQLLTLLGALDTLNLISKRPLSFLPRHWDLGMDYVKIQINKGLDKGYN